jgi:hypothetical protein
MKHVVEIGSSAMIYIPSFVKSGSGIHGNIISLLFIFSKQGK